MSRVASVARGATALALLAFGAAGAAPQPPDTPFESGFLAAVERTAAGQRVFAVDNGTPRMRSRAPGPSADGVLLDQLQALCEGFSAKDRPIIPFKVRETWVLAPQYRNEVILDYRAVTTQEAMGRGALIDQAVSLVPPSLWKALGSEEGVGFRDLPPEARSLLTRALQPPFGVEGQSPSFLGHGGSVSALPAVTAPVDLRNVRLRIQLRSTGISWKSPVAENAGVWSPPPGNNVPERLLFRSGDPQTGSSDRPFSPPRLENVANTFKPSDLDGAKYPGPLGIKGQKTVAEVAKRLSTATGMKMTVSPQFLEWPVYVGSEAVTCGEAMDGLRLALTAAWRKLGDTYILAWDRRGIATVMALADEASKAPRTAVESEQSEAHAVLRAIVASGTTAFAADDPFAWSDEQRRALTAPPPDPDKEWGSGAMPRRTSNIPYNQMTAEQQKAVRSLLTAAEMQAQKDNAQYIERGEEPPIRLVPSSASPETAWIQGEMLAEVSVSVPRIGWVHLNHFGPRFRADSILIAARAEWLRANQARLAEKHRSEHPEMYVARPAPPPSPIRPAKDRGLVVPVLPADQLLKTMAAMPARRFQTLYYPVLIDGYATFPTKTFPLHPSLNGRNGWAEAVKAAQAKGIRVVGLVETHIWSRPGLKDHWAVKTKVPLDLDVLGRPYTAAFAASESTAFGGVTPGVRGDLIAPLPAVTQRLSQLLDDWMKQPPGAGVLFDAWNPKTAVLFGPPPYIVMGYSPGARERTMAAKGYDPVDVVGPDASFVPSDIGATFKPGATYWLSSGQGLLETFSEQPAPETEPHLEALQSLVDRIRAARPNAPLLATWNGERPSFRSSPVPLGVTQVDLQGRWSTNHSALLMRMPPMSALKSVGGGSFDSRNVMAGAERYNRWLGDSPVNVAIYDFRGAPEEVLPALEAVVLPPEPKPAQ